MMFLSFENEGTVKLNVKILTLLVKNSVPTVHAPGMTVRPGKRAVRALRIIIRPPVPYHCTRKGDNPGLQEQGLG
jgi:hypothetical protein